MIRDKVVNECVFVSLYEMFSRDLLVIDDYCEFVGVKILCVIFNFYKILFL